MRIDPFTEVSTQFEIDSAHHLPNYVGKCSQVHGHHWIIEVGYTGWVDKQTGMVIDFTDLKKAIGPIVEELDHRDLNDFIENPTAENIIEYLLEKIKKVLKIPGGYRLSLTVWETPKNKAKASIGT